MKDSWEHGIDFTQVWFLMSNYFPVRQLKQQHTFSAINH